MTPHQEYSQHFGPEKADMLHIIPPHMIEGMVRYIIHGIPPGSFQQAILRGDLFEAMRRADDINVRAIGDYGKFLLMAAPIGCFGSEEHVSDWVKARGMTGITSNPDEETP